MKIAHFSDLHINTSVRDSNVNETIALFEHALKNGAEHFFLTGDLSHNAEEEDFEILRYILEYFNLLDPQKATVVIGNHDIFGGPQKAEDVFTFPQKCRDVDYNAKVNAFENYFKELTEETVYKSVNNVYPFAKIIKNHLFIGMNSIARYSSVKNPFASNGFIDDDQITELKTILNEFGSLVQTRILLVHHHFNKLKIPASNMMHYFWQVVEKQTMKLREKKKLMRELKESGIDLVCHGHIHVMDEYIRKGIRFLNSGGGMNLGAEGELSYSMIEIEKDGIFTDTMSLSYIKKKKNVLNRLMV
jgi:3',5'-cyclic AMP phosphodiesterase CpdA